MKGNIIKQSQLLICPFYILEIPAFFYMETTLQTNSHYATQLTNTIINEILQDSLDRGIAQQKLSHNYSKFNKVYGQFLGNFFQQITHTTTIPSDIEKIPFKQQSVLVKLEPEPQRSLNHPFEPKIEIRYVTLQNKNPSQLTLKSNLNIRTNKRLGTARKVGTMINLQTNKKLTYLELNNKPRLSNIPSTNFIEAADYPQRKKYYSDYNKIDQKRFIKLNINTQNKEQQEQAIITQKIHQNYRNLKTSFDIFNKSNFFSHPPSKKTKIKKSHSLPNKDFPLLESINTVQYNVPKQKKRCEGSSSNLKEEKVTLKLSAKPSELEKPDGAKQKLHNRRQTRSKTFFDRYHSQPNKDHLLVEKNILKENSNIKLVGQSELSLGQIFKSKEKKLIEKNILQASKKALTILGGRQRRSINGPSQHKAELKLPHLHVKLKIQPRNKENTLENKNQITFGMVEAEAEGKVRVANRISLDSMIRYEEIFANFQLDRRVEVQQGEKRQIMQNEKGEHAEGNLSKEDQAFRKNNEKSDLSLSSSSSSSQSHKNEGQEVQTLPQVSKISRLLQQRIQKKIKTQKLEQKGQQKQRSSQYDGQQQQTQTQIQYSSKSLTNEQVQIQRRDERQLIRVIYERNEMSRDKYGKKSKFYYLSLC